MRTGDSLVDLAEVLEPPATMLATDRASWWGGPSGKTQPIGRTVGWASPTPHKDPRCSWTSPPTPASPMPHGIYHNLLRFLLPLGRHSTAPGIGCPALSPSLLLAYGAPVCTGPFVPSWAGSWAVGKERGSHCAALRHGESEGLSIVSDSQFCCQED